MSISSHGQEGGIQLSTPIMENCGKNKSFRDRNIRSKWVGATNPLDTLNLTHANSQSRMGLSVGFSAPATDSAHTGQVVVAANVQMAERNMAPISVLHSPRRKACVAPMLAQHKSRGRPGHIAADTANATKRQWVRTKSDPPNIEPRKCGYTERKSKHSYPYPRCGGQL